VPSQSLLIVHVLVDPEFDTVAVTEPSHFAGDKETEVEPTALEAVYAPLTPLKVNDNFVTSELVTTVYWYFVASVPVAGLGVAELMVGTAHTGAETTTVNVFVAVLPAEFVAVTVTVRVPRPTRSLLITHVRVEPLFETAAVVEPPQYAKFSVAVVDPTALLTS